MILMILGERGEAREIWIRELGEAREMERSEFERDGV